MNDTQLRAAARAIGMATVAFGVVPFASPRAFSALFGLVPGEEPTVAAAFRSVGARDIAIGLGIWSAATHGGNYAPWLLARTVCDAGDTVAALLAIRAGVRDPRFLGLTGMAAGAAVLGAFLWRQARAQSHRP
jgi:hypothetical protein